MVGTPLLHIHSHSIYTNTVLLDSVHEADWLPPQARLAPPLRRCDAEGRQLQGPSPSLPARAPAEPNWYHVRNTPLACELWATLQRCAPLLLLRPQQLMLPAPSLSPVRSMILTSVQERLPPSPLFRGPCEGSPQGVSHAKYTNCTSHSEERVLGPQEGESEAGMAYSEVGPSFDGHTVRRARVVQNAL